MKLRLYLLRAWYLSTRGRVRGRLAEGRAFYWMVIRRHDSEICHHCGRPVNTVWWCHDDLLWEKVTGEPKPFGSRESAAGIFCISCFDASAKAVCPWIEWAPLNLRHLQTPQEETKSVEARRRASE